MTVAPLELLHAVRSFDSRMMAVVESFTSHGDADRMRGEYGAARREVAEAAGIRPVLLDAAWDHYSRLPQDSLSRVNGIEIPA